MTMSEQMNSQIATWVGVAGTSASIYQGEEGRRLQKRGLKSQEKAQMDAEARARAQQRRQEEVQRLTSERRPNIGAILAEAQRSGSTGLSSTQLGGSLRHPLGGQ